MSVRGARLVLLVALVAHTALAADAPVDVSPAAVPAVLPEQTPVEPPNEGFSLHLSRGAVHFAITHALIGASAGLLGVLVEEPHTTVFPPVSRAMNTPAAVGTGLVALFVGGGLVAGRLADPSPPMAWHATFAGAAGAGLGLGLALTHRFDTYSSLLLVAGGYASAVFLDLLMPDRARYSWNAFWVSLLAGLVPCGAIAVIGALSNSRGSTYEGLLMGSPVVGMLLSRLLLWVFEPFSAWEEDAIPPAVRANPVVSFNTTGATVGVAVIW